LSVKNLDDQTSIDMETLYNMVDTFLERGFTYFDTPYMYHAFKSEIALREALVKRHDRNSFTVATKMPTMFLKKKEDQERIFSEQLDKCGVVLHTPKLILSSCSSIIWIGTMKASSRENVMKLPKSTGSRSLSWNL